MPTRHLPVSDLPIYPTHTCFDDALDFLVDVLRDNPRERAALAQQLFLVHGLCQAPDGRLYAHAWVEDAVEDTCIFTGILDGTRRVFATPAHEYYAEVRVQEMTRYNLIQALQNNRFTNSYGPWEARYQAQVWPPGYGGRP